VFTVGDDAILYGRKGASVKRFKPLPVKVVDSAGAGDSFRAGVAYGLLQNWTMTKSFCMLQQLPAWYVKDFQLF
jgi:sugar/nucleoside kinase (ribokinase family)